VRRPRAGGRQIGIVAEMKPDQEDRLGARGGFSQSREFSPERLQPPEILGEVGNPVLETIRQEERKAFLGKWALINSKDDYLHLNAELSVRSSLRSAGLWARRLGSAYAGFRLDG
jgi:hypothetical protein